MGGLDLALVPAGGGRFAPGDARIGNGWQEGLLRVGKGHFWVGESSMGSGSDLGGGGIGGSSACRILTLVVLHGLLRFVSAK